MQLARHEAATLKKKKKSKTRCCSCFLEDVTQGKQHHGHLVLCVQALPAQGGSFHGPHLQLRNNGPTLLTPASKEPATVNSHEQRDADSEVLWLCSEYTTLQVINLACSDCGSH